MVPRKTWVSLSLAVSLALSAPGLPAYQAAAAEVSGASASAFPTRAWLPVLQTAVTRLQAFPDPASADALRMLGQARLELSIAPRASQALLFAAELPDEAADPARLAGLPAARQAELLSQAAHRASERLSARTEALLERAESGQELSSEERRRLHELDSCWFYLPPAQAARVIALYSQRALSLSQKLAQALNRVLKRDDVAVQLAQAESRQLFADTRRLAQGGAAVRETLAPYAVRTIEEAGRRLEERGVPRGKLPVYLLIRHRQAFGWDAEHSLIDSMRRTGQWSEFVAAVSISAAESLSRLDNPQALENLRKAGSYYDLRLAIPSWHALSGRHESVAQWLSSTYGAPAAEPLGAGLKLGRVLGIPILVKRGALLMMAAFAWQLRMGAMAIVPAVAASLLFYMGLIIHELGHALAARLFKTRARRIVLGILVGGIQLERHFRRALPQFLVAFAGPVTTLALAATSFWLTRSGMIPASFRPALAVLTLYNLVLGLGNLLPVVPMDGGRMLQGLLTWALRDDYRAARWSRLFGRGLAWAGLAAAPLLLLTGHAAWALPALIIGIVAWVGRGPTSAHPGTTLISE